MRTIKITRTEFGYLEASLPPFVRIINDKGNLVLGELEFEIVRDNELFGDKKGGI